MDDLVKLIDSVGSLLSAVVLPIAVVVVFRMFRIELNGFIHRAKRIEASVGGAKVVVDSQQQEVEGAIQLAYENAPAERKESGVLPEHAQVAAAVAARAVTPAAVQNASGATILWVDDRPENNVYERRAIEAIGASIVLATSTGEGVSKALAQTFDVVISDMSRGIERDAGYQLIDQLRKKGIQTPVILYVGRMDPKLRAAAREHGAVDATNRPDVLLQLVVSVLNSTGPAPAKPSTAA